MNEETVLKALDEVIDPELGQSLVKLNMIHNIKIEGDNVAFDLILTTPGCPLVAMLKANAEKAVIDAGASEVDIHMLAYTS